MSVLGILGCSLIVLGMVAQKTVEESDTGALLTFPSVLDGPLYGMEWEVSPAQFGYQSYGGSIEAYLVIPHNTSYHTECPGSTQEKLYDNRYIALLRDSIDMHDEYGFVFVIDRGDCYFVEKVELAQSLGAKACIIVDHTPESLFTMWMPDNWEDDVDIPSVLLDELDGEVLYQHLGVKNWQPKNIQGTTYPVPGEFNWTLATIEWGLPHDDDRVEWELWTSSNDPLAVTFKQNFKATSLLLDNANDTVFEPRMYILNGAHWGCNSFPDLKCGNQCSNQGRYCSVDPEYDLENGISGIDVIQENLRNLCVWNYTKRQDELHHNLDESTWWDYAVMWDTNCAFANITDINSHKFTENCSFDQMDSIDHSQKLKKFVMYCIKSTGGYGINDTENSMLENEVTFREANGVYAMPMVRVNEFLIHGNIDCNVLNTDHCQVLAAICAGFVTGTAPDICASMPPTRQSTSPPVISPTVSPTSPECIMDACGDCKLVSDPTWNSCRGCDGQIRSGYALNPCGICMHNDATNFDSYGTDCAGECGGLKEYDQCSQCLQPSDSEFNNCINIAPSTTGGANFDLKLIIIIAVVVVLVIIIVVFIFVGMKKKQQSLENKLSQLAGNYEFFEDNPESTNVNVDANININKKKNTKGKRVNIKTDEDEDQIL